MQQAGGTAYPVFRMQRQALQQACLVFPRMCNIELSSLESTGHPAWQQQAIPLGEAGTRGWMAGSP
jgi:hypothetical protein